MPRGPTTFRQRDVAALLRAVKAAGLTVTRVELNEHRVILETAEHGFTDAHEPAETNEWDQ